LLLLPLPPLLPPPVPEDRALQLAIHCRASNTFGGTSLLLAGAADVLLLALLLLLLLGAAAPPLVLARQLAIH
jgi:hypothetical protein